MEILRRLKRFGKRSHATVKLQQEVEANNKKIPILGEDEWKLIFYHLEFRQLIRCQYVCKLWYKWIHEVYKEMTHLTTVDTNYCLLSCSIDHINSTFNLANIDV